MSHTRGPWLYDCGVVPPDGPGRYSDIYATAEGGDLTIIASVNEMRGWSPEEGKANAQLITAAPDLLAELKWCMIGAGNRTRMAAAIAKAEGRS